jgi:pimeloyl-ACP methyl ester carboxylesterase
VTDVQPFTAPTADGEIVGVVSGLGPPALLLHGGPGLSDYLASLAAELDGILTMARYQQRGLPPSVEDGDRTVEGHVADAVAVLDALGWDRAWIIGHSWGGHLAMHLAVSHPERCLGLVSIDALGALPDGGARAMGENLTRDLSNAQRARMEALDDREESGDFSEADALENLGIVWPHYFADPVAAPPMPALRIDLAGAGATWASIRDHFAAGTLERGLTALRMPSLFIHGARSPIPPAETERCAALVPGAVLRLVKNAGHWPWLERPGSVRTAVEELLRTSP